MGSSKNENKKEKVDDDSGEDDTDKQMLKKFRKDCKAFVKSTEINPDDIGPDQ